MTVVDAVSPSMRAAFLQFATSHTYTLADKSLTQPVPAFARGLREDDLFAEAMQQDMVVIVDAVSWNAALTGQASPRKLDRVTLPSGSYTVEAWRAAPSSGVPVFYKLLVRGGQQ